MDSAYLLIAELLLHPVDRHPAAVASWRERLARQAPDRMASLDRFFASPQADSADEYVQTLELSPPCPLYLGSYLFEEPTTCRGVGTSGRNAYMLELGAVYRHFGFELSGGELTDYAPAVAEFLAVSAGCSERDRIGLRRRLLEQYVQPALPLLRARLERYQSPYAFVIEALEGVVAEDLRLLGDTPAWVPPARPAGRRGLPVLEPAGAMKTEAGV